MTGFDRVKSRASFVAVARQGQHWVTPAFIVQALADQEGADQEGADQEGADQEGADQEGAGQKSTNQKGAEAEDRPPRFGFTVSRKVGKAVVRNRVRRRLREVVRRSLGKKARRGWVYVLIARRREPEPPFASLVRDAEWAIRKLHHRHDRHHRHHKQDRQGRKNRAEKPIAPL